MLKEYDHGVLSAILLIMESNNKKWSSVEKKEIDENALAIALHNYHKALCGDINQLDDDKKGPAIKLGALNLKDYPLAYLLSYCDTAQEWGRSDSGNSPISINYSSIDINDNASDIHILINYVITPKDEKSEPQEIADKIKTKESKKIKEMKDSWISNMWRYYITLCFFEKEKEGDCEHDLSQESYPACTKIAS